MQHAMGESCFMPMATATEVLDVTGITGFSGIAPKVMATKGDGQDDTDSNNNEGRHFMSPLCGGEDPTADERSLVDVMMAENAFSEMSSVVDPSLLTPLFPAAAVRM
jgi:hypothetical protein